MEYAYHPQIQVGLAGNMVSGGNPAGEPSISSHLEALRMTLAECLQTARCLNDRIQGPRPEAVGSDASKGIPNTLQTLRMMQDESQELSSLLLRLNQVI